MPASNFFRAVPLGGLGRIGGNMMVYETADDLIVVDCGVNFPGPDEPGVDWLVPDVTYLREHRDKLRGYVITHGHEDHVGALPYVHPEIPAPVYATPFTLAILRHKLREHDLEAELHTIRDGERFSIGGFDIDPIPVTHSIPEAIALALHTPVGVVVHTGDFKIDPSPVDGRHFAEDTLRDLGDAGVTALFSDSTNATRAGHTVSETTVADALVDLVGRAKGRVLVTTFSSNVHRLQSIVRAAAAANRVAVAVGRSAVNFIELGLEGGLLDVPPGVLRQPEELNGLARDRVVVIASGCQGEEYSAFGRIAADNHPLISVGAGDTVVMSARKIPGNERSIGRACNALLQRGVEIIDDRREPNVHTSGHAYRDEQAKMIDLCRPRFFVPLHGEVRHMRAHAELGAAAGAEVHLLGDGDPLEFSRAEGDIVAQQMPSVPAGFQWRDGHQNVPEIVLRDRKVLSNVGFVSCAVALDADLELLAPPMIITRGVVHVDESPELLERAGAAVEAAIGELDVDCDEAAIYDAVRLALRRLFKKELGRRPLILPAVLLSDGGEGEVS